MACTERWTWFRWACSVRASRQVASTCAPAAAVTPVSSPEGTRSQRWLARLSFLLAGAAIVILVVFAGLKSVAMLAVGLAAAAVSLAAAFFFLSRRGICALAVAGGLRPCADCRDRRLRVQGPAVGGHRVGRGVAAREHDRTRGAGRGSCGLADARASGAAAGPAPVPDHEPEVRRREGREVRPETQGRRPRRRGLPHRRARARRRRPGGPRGRGQRRRSARRRRRRRHAGPGGRRGRRAWPPVRGDHRGHAQSFRP